MWAAVKTGAAVTVDPTVTADHVLTTLARSDDLRSSVAGTFVDDPETLALVAEQPTRSIAYTDRSGVLGPDDTAVRTSELDLTHGAVVAALRRGRKDLDLTYESRVLLAGSRLDQWTVFAVLAAAITGAVVVPAGPDHDPGILVDEEWVTHGFVPADELAALPDTEDLVAVVVTDGPAHDGVELSAGLAGKLSDLRSPWVLQE